MKQRTAEKPEAIRLEASEQAGFVEMVVITNAKEIKSTDLEAGERTEYESNIARLTYPAPEDKERLIEYAKAHVDIFAQLAEAEENRVEPTQNADKLVALMVENAALHETQDDIILTITDIMGGVEDAE